MRTRAVLWDIPIEKSQVPHLRQPAVSPASPPACTSTYTPISAPMFVSICASQCASVQTFRSRLTTSGGGSISFDSTEAQKIFLHTANRLVLLLGSLNRRQTYRVQEAVAVLLQSKHPIRWRLFWAAGRCLRRAIVPVKKQTRLCWVERLRTKTDGDRQGGVEKVLRRRGREERDGAPLVVAAFSRALARPTIQSDGGGTSAERTGELVHVHVMVSLWLSPGNRSASRHSRRKSLEAKGTLSPMPSLACISASTVHSGYNSTGRSTSLTAHGAPALSRVRQYLESPVCLVAL